MKSLKTITIVFLLLIPFLQAQEKQTLKFDFFLRDTDNDQYAIKFPHGMAFDKEESVYILDWKECNILKFSVKGEFLTSIDIENKGPAKVCIGNISIKDEKLYYLSGWKFIDVYKTDGKLLTSDRKKYTQFSTIQAFPEKFLIGTRYENRENLDLLMKWNWSGDEEEVIDIINYDKYLKPSKRRYRISAIATFNADTHVFDLDSKGAVIYAKTNKYEIFKWLDGKRESIIKEKHPYKLLPNEKRLKSHIEKKQGAIAYIIGNDFYPIISKIMVDSEDNIWVVTNTFDSAGLAKYTNDGKFIAFYEIEPWYLIEKSAFYMSTKYIYVYCRLGSDEGLGFFRAEIPK